MQVLPSGPRTNPSRQSHLKIEKENDLKIARLAKFGIWKNYLKLPSVLTQFPPVQRVSSRHSLMSKQFFPFELSWKPKQTNCYSYDTKITRQNGVTRSADAAVRALRIDTSAVVATSVGKKGTFVLIHAVAAVGRVDIPEQPTRCPEEH